MIDWNSVVVPGLQETVALAAVALTGYLFGQRTRRPAEEVDAVDHQSEIDRATRIAHQLEQTATALRTELATHHAKLLRFKRRLRTVKNDGNEMAWESLCEEAEAILSPTLQLANQLSQAYDQIRQQSNSLLAFSEGRIDPVTGVGNGRALEELLNVLLASQSRSVGRFSIALIGLDPNAETDAPLATVTENTTEAELRDLADLIQTTLRDHDFVARYGGDEFVVVMPQTGLAGGCVFGDRLRRKVRTQLSTTVCCGLAVATDGDGIKELLARADSALYSAKATGPDRQFAHNCVHIREHKPAATGQDTDSKTEQLEPAGCGAE